MVDLDRGYGDRGVVSCCKAKHRVTMVCAGGSRVGLVRGVIRGQKKELVKPEEFRNRLRDAQMPAMHGIEGPAIKCDPFCSGVHDCKMIDNGRRSLFIRVSNSLGFMLLDRVVLG